MAMGSSYSLLDVANSNRFAGFLPALRLFKKYRASSPNCRQPFRAAPPAREDFRSSWATEDETVTDTLNNEPRMTRI
jgi:hypothetical protein